MRACLLPLLIAMTALAACGQNAPFRTSVEACAHSDVSATAAPCRDHSLLRFRGADTPGDSYVLGIVELDDQGQLHDRKQLDAVLREIEGHENPLVEVFVHGWKHNASAGDRNLEEFRRLLVRAAAQERRITGGYASMTSDAVPALERGDQRAFEQELEQLGRPRSNLPSEEQLDIWKQVRKRPEFQAMVAAQRPRAVVGVYIGWRGGSLAVPGLENATFWGRKNASDKVGEGAVTEILLRLDLLTRFKSEQLRRKMFDFTEALNAPQDGRIPDLTPQGLPSQLIVIGHSMGASIVHTAVSQILMERYLQSCYEPLVPNEAGCTVRGFGDLVLMINPAFEAIRFEAMSSLLAHDASTRFSARQTPVFAILTSEADSATRIAFPLGRSVSTVLEKERSDQDQSAKNKTAIGHYAAYRTHTLAALDPVKNADCDGGAGKGSFRDLPRFISALTGRDAAALDAEMPGIGVRLSRVKGVAPYDPYLFVYVDEYLVPSHNEIYDCRFLRFLDALITLKIFVDWGAR